VTLNLEGPKAGEVLVEIQRAECCIPMSSHAPALIRKALFPVVLGHEGAESWST